MNRYKQNNNINRKLIALLIVSSAITACSDSSDRRSATVEPQPELVLCGGSEANPSRLFLQQLGSDQVIVKWRGNIDGGDDPDRVCFSTDMNALEASSETVATVTATGHSEARLTGLAPDTTYYYSIGGAGTADAARSFHTSPADNAVPSDGNTRIWIVGDSGVGGEGKTESIDVRNGFLSYMDASGGEKPDLFLMLGDNAYREGTDLQHQQAIFEIYPSVLANTPVWPTIGNHEMGTLGISTSSDPNSFTVFQDAEIHGGPDEAPDSPMPYLNIFTLPTAGETGGLASGTEQYYSFNYANVHVVSLDSQLTARDKSSRAAMLTWLEDDLMSNTSDWTIVIFHHPPYTKGSHDSDTPLGEIDQPIFDMREQFTPVFDAYGVDLVYGGHSHIYERSYYLTGHTGLSDSFDPQLNAELNDAGEPASGQGDEAYTQISRNGTDDKVVYTVAGNSGKITFTSNGFPHPAHFFSELTLGSVVIDINEDVLEARFVDDKGDVQDSFVITRSGS
ncbi:MAG: hypothetical protein ACJAUG_000863 [Halioglobus sp.]|jgi:hypothetical protein